MCFQEDDVIGILSTDNIADLKPLGDRILVEVSYTSCESNATPVHSPQKCRVMRGAVALCSDALQSPQVLNTGYEGPWNSLVRLSASLAKRLLPVNVLMV